MIKGRTEREIGDKLCGIPLVTSKGKRLTVDQAEDKLLAGSNGTIARVCAWSKDRNKGGGGNGQRRKSWGREHKLLGALARG